MSEVKHHMEPFVCRLHKFGDHKIPPVTQLRWLPRPQTVNTTKIFSRDSRLTAVKLCMYN